MTLPAVNIFVYIALFTFIYLSGKVLVSVSGQREYIFIISIGITLNSLHNLYSTKQLGTMISIILSIKRYMKLKAMM